MWLARRTKSPFTEFNKFLATFNKTVPVTSLNVFQ